MTTKAGKQAAKRKARMVKTVSQIQAKRERQVKRRSALSVSAKQSATLMPGESRRRSYAR